MEAESIDPTITQAVTEIVNRFGAPGLDQLESATAQARADAQRAIIALVERPDLPAAQPSDDAAPADDGAPAGDDAEIHDPEPHDDEQPSEAPPVPTDAARRLAEWRAASDAVRSECESYWQGWADHADTADREAPTEEDRRRLNAFYSVEQAARDQFFSLIDASL